MSRAIKWIFVMLVIAAVVMLVGPAVFSIFVGPGFDP